MYYLMICLVLIASGCSSISAKRIDANKNTDLSGTWNDTDARLVAKAMIEDCLAARWVDDFGKAKGRSPVVIIGTVKNKTNEHISTDVFVDTWQKALLDSGKVEFVASNSARQEIRDERLDQQQGNTEPGTISEKGHETGADFMLQGSVNQIEEEAETQTLMVGKRRSTNFFQVTVELVDLKTNQKRWMAQQQIKKSIQRSKIFL